MLYSKVMNHQTLPSFELTFHHTDMCVCNCGDEEITTHEGGKNELLAWPIGEQSLLVG